MSFKSSMSKLVRWLSDSCQKETVNQHISSSLEYSTFIGPQTFYVVFRDSDCKFLGKSLLKKGFSHVTLVQKHDFGWVMLNPNRAHLHCEIMEFGVDEDPMKLLKMELPEVTILKVKVNIDCEVDNFFYPITCVQMANYCLGLTWAPFTCITPYQLYKRLLEREHQNLLLVSELI